MTALADSCSSTDSGITAPAALEIATGALTGACYFRHSREQFLAFLNTLGEALPAPAIAPCPGQLFHHSTHQVKRRLERHTRAFPLHSDRRVVDDIVEIWFSMLTKQQARRGPTNTSPN